MSTLESRTRGATLAVVFVAGALLAACTEEPPSLPSASAVADRFLESWAGEDFSTMASLLDDASARAWPARRLARTISAVNSSGAITDVRLERSAPVEQPRIDSAEELDDDISVDVPFTLDYTSDASSEPVSFAGSLRMTYDGAERGWRFDWSKRLLWPGTPRAAGFEIRLRYPKRAPILDRRGRKLATGGADSRRYPFGVVGGSTVGHVGALTRADLSDAPEGSEEGDIVGDSGLERAYDDRLSGTPTTRLTLVTRKGKSIEVVGRTRGRPGRALRTTLDAEVQRAAEGAFGSTVGGAVVLHPRTGDLLAVVSSAPFDPNNYAGATDIVPFNRALSGLYPPGSSMKVVTASAALDTGVMTPGSIVTGPKEYKGVSNFESGVFGEIPFSTAVQNSVNTAFAQVAERLGGRRLTRYAEAFGFNREPDMHLQTATPSFPRPESLSDLMWGSIGQAQVVATPLEMATIAATVANDGKRMEPRIDRGVSKRGERVISRKTARTMNTLMQQVVQAGTGVNAQISGVAVAGKTGTAEISVDGKIKNHAWFVCFAPAERPRVAVAVVSEFGGIGGQVAAPIARNVLVNVLPLVR
jgi:peptidoglycan glycosyltransferase